MSEHVQTCQNMSKHVKTCQNMSTCQNVSKHVKMSKHVDMSEHVKNIKADATDATSHCCASLTLSTAQSTKTDWHCRVLIPCIETEAVEYCCNALRLKLLDVQASASAVRCSWASLPMTLLSRRSATTQARSSAWSVPWTRCRETGQASSLTPQAGGPQVGNAVRVVHPKP
jgi:hypothetical protein